MPVPIGRCIEPRYVPMGDPRRDESREYCILWNAAAAPFLGGPTGGLLVGRHYSRKRKTLYDPDGLETRKVLRRA